MVSPDGRWIAYESDESGQLEVYIRPFPGVERKWRVSNSGGVYPVWNPEGGELFYRNGDGMISVAVDVNGEELSLGKPVTLFRRSFASTIFRNYDVGPDGDHFIALGDVGGSLAPTQLILVQHFDEELTQRAPPP